MKVILLQSIKGKGQKGDVIEVSDGYAQNALFPKGLAKAATSQEINKLKLAQDSLHHKEEKLKKEILLAFEVLNGKNLIIKEKVNEKGSLYRAVTNKEILEALKRDFRVDLPDSSLSDKHALKETGDYQIEFGSYGKKITLLVSIQSQ
ncbi:MAG: 50S ribosomal protein L9 [Candidatus Pacebacteria bacterium]|nr:50S ribosomal protein L9 [Candidatus Paceibacterota bacterium]